MAALASLLLSGCLTRSICQGDEECDSSESCNLSTGECFSECASDGDCTAAGPVRACQRGRCQIRLDERVAAPEVCLRVINPKSTSYDKNLCLSSLKGKVVLLFFGLLA